MFRTRSAIQDMLFSRVRPARPRTPLPVAPPTSMLPTEPMEPMELSDKLFTPRGPGPKHPTSDSDSAIPLGPSSASEEEGCSGEIEKSVVIEGHVHIVKMPKSYSFQLESIPSNAFDQMSPVNKRSQRVLDNVPGCLGKHAVCENA